MPCPQAQWHVSLRRPSRSTPDILVRPGAQRGQEGGICGAQVQAHRGQRQAMVMLAGLAHCGRIHIGQDLFCVMQKQAVEGWLFFPAHTRIEAEGFVPKDKVHSMQVMKPSKLADRTFPVLSATGSMRLREKEDGRLAMCMDAVKPVAGDPRYIKHFTDVIPLQVLQVQISLYV